MGRNMTYQQRYLGATRIAASCYNVYSLYSSSTSRVNKKTWFIVGVKIDQGVNTSLFAAPIAELRHEIALGWCVGTLYMILKASAVLTELGNSSPLHTDFAKQTI